LYTRCLVCGTPFEANDQLEHLPHGSRVAFDPARGRLWTVCRSCRRWSLSPIEDRWEALEELERLTTDKARLLSKTDNIALLRSGPLEIVRVGKAQLTEEAWWRYGRELTTRKRTWDKLGFAGTVAAGAVVAGGWATGGMTLLGVWLILGHGSAPPGLRTQHGVAAVGQLAFERPAGPFALSGDEQQRRRCIGVFHGVRYGAWSQTISSGGPASSRLPPRSRWTLRVAGSV
jgi:hypothetical protein